MAYHIEDTTKDIVIDGFEKGIAPSPYKGISDMRNVNIISVPGEASVNFSTTSITYPIITNATVSSADATGDTITFSGALNLEVGMTITFSVSTVGGVSISTPYWVGVVTSGVTCQLFTDQARSSLVNITSTGTGTFSTLNMAQPTNTTYDSNNNFSFIVDSSGRVWGNNKTTATGYWTYLGNTTLTNANGNGLIAYVASPSGGSIETYLFVFRNARIDYTRLSTVSWVYGWDPTSGGSGVSSMNTANGTNNSHFSLVGQDNVVYYCDASFLGSFFEKNGSVFDPTSTATFTYAQKALALPRNDTANCLAELGVNLLTGGLRNAIYPWNRSATSFSYPILIAENGIAKMVTVNTNTYIFPGNRGRVYITNGSQANLYKKVPDHLSGTVEPYYTWGGAAFTKNQLYFGVSATTNAGVAITQYGGVWGIDLDTAAIRLIQKLSYGTYAGIASTILPIAVNSGVNPSGIGLYTGWYDGSANSGVDITSSTPYTGGQAYVDSDLIPIGTFLKPAPAGQVEYKLAVPLVAGESVQLFYRQKFSDAYTSIAAADTAVGTFSNVLTANFEKSQWIQIRAVLTSTASSPSYVRLTEIRIR